MQTKILFFSGLFLAFLFSSRAQYFKSQPGYDIFSNYSRLGFQVDGLVFSAAETGNPPEGTDFKSQSALGYKAGVVYNFSLVPNFGLRIGALIGKNPAANTYFQLDASRTGEPQDYTHTRGALYSNLSFAFPLLAEYRNFSFDPFVTSLAAGIQVQRTGAQTFTESYGNYYQLQVSNPGSWDFDFIIKAGVYFQFSRFMMQPNIVYKYRLQDQYTGTYTFSNLQNPALNNETQVFAQKGNYIGLSLDFYIFTPHRQISAGCAGSVHSKEVMKRKRAQEKERMKLEKKKRKAFKKRRKKAEKGRRKSFLKRIFG